MRTRTLAAWLLLPCALAAAPPVRSAQAVAEEPDLRIDVRREAVEDLIAAAMPYELKLDLGVFEEVVVLTDPRQVRFFPGGVSLELTATGSPVGFQATVQPVIRLEEGSGDAAYHVRIESMPVRIGMAGTYDLAAFLPVIPIETLTEILLNTRDKEIPMQLVVRGIRIHQEGIEILLQADFP